MSVSTLLFNRQKNRQLLALATPMILSNITIPLLGLVDTAVIGHLEQAYYLGGVALGSTIITLMIWLLGFLRMSTTGLVAQAYGANDTSTQQQLLIQGCSLALTLGLVGVILQSPLLNLALSLSDASEQVMLYCRQYVEIRIWSLPFALTNLVLLGWLLGRQAPKAAMWQLIIANSVNIILDLVFVMVFKWNVQGVALASVIADICAFSVALVMVKRQLVDMGGLKLSQVIAHLSWRGYARLLTLNRDIFIRSLCLQAAFSFMTFYGAGLGDNIIAANAVLLNLLMLISYALDGIAYYAEAEVGRAFGQKNPILLHDSVVLAFCWSAMVAVLFSLLFWLAGPWIIQLLTNIEAVQDTANNYLIWLVFMPILAFGCYLFDGVYIGAAHGQIMRNSMIVATFGIYFPCWYVLQDWGNHSLWAAMSIFMLCRSLTLGWHYYYKLRYQLLTTS
ncbi:MULTISPECIES: MATE family efflux transporter DinF [Shewanella]|uniref:MATE family efflux transporter DinF n=1 Tax=Shewanella psychromarinicola TaxID=2487742 RepID=A0A3N4E5G3_9GAMM|nr:MULTISPECIES: MATE family efflux transporter DinF [Shewanella]AZG34054.1 MATE family efflux transporter DinF [Shewanella psychromarinicola]MCL1081285.1 MATE family efflux transporter DinF [Shewanella psychromarinicola]PKG79063.1 MATE family efflux transporter DinF [Shewanella sp. Actino-trap-3]RPA32147.1 MATE family efflux transporter DinF [Shewanella psychromarinicola]|tara:strand:+ start:22043 stop:23389 length:1347 start_codon:yes stop_codon:yes gene_type:complete